MGRLGLYATKVALGDRAWISDSTALLSLLSSNNHVKLKMLFLRVAFYETIVLTCLLNTPPYLLLTSRDIQSHVGHTEKALKRENYALTCILDWRRGSLMSDWPGGLFCFYLPSL